jgi:multidrug efflux pump subunit AcrB
MKKEHITYLEKIQDTFFGWRVKNFRVSFLLIALLIVYGSFSLIQIPKESAPNIKF